MGKLKTLRENENGPQMIDTLLGNYKGELLKACGGDMELATELVLEVLSKNTWGDVVKILKLKERDFVKVSFQAYNSAIHALENIHALTHTVSHSPTKDLKIELLKVFDEWAIDKFYSFSRDPGRRDFQLEMYSKAHVRTLFNLPGEKLGAKFGEEKEVEEKTDHGIGLTPQQVRENLTAQLSKVTGVTQTTKSEVTTTTGGKKEPEVDPVVKLFNEFATTIAELGAELDLNNDNAGFERLQVLKAFGRKFEKNPMLPKILKHKNADGQTLLHLAVCVNKPNSKVLNWLISAEANLNAKDLGNMTPYQCAVYRGDKTAIDSFPVKNLDSENRNGASKIVVNTQKSLLDSGMRYIGFSTSQQQRPSQQQPSSQQQPQQQQQQGTSDGLPPPPPPPPPPGMSTTTTTTITAQKSRKAEKQDVNNNVNNNLSSDKIAPPEALFGLLAERKDQEALKLLESIPNLDITVPHTNEKRTLLDYANDYGCKRVLERLGEMQLRERLLEPTEEMFSLLAQKDDKKACDLISEQRLPVNPDAKHEGENRTLLMYAQIYGCKRTEQHLQKIKKDIDSERQKYK